MAKIREGMSLRRASQLVVDQVGFYVCMCVWMGRWRVGRAYGLTDINDTFPFQSNTEQGIVASYVHNAAAPMMGQAGALVGIKTDASGDKLAQVR